MCLGILSETKRQTDFINIFLFRIEVADETQILRRKRQLSNHVWLWLEMDLFSRDKLCYPDSNGDVWETTAYTIIQSTVYHLSEDPAYSLLNFGLLVARTKCLFSLYVFLCLRTNVDTGLVFILSVIFAHQFVICNIFVFSFWNCYFNPYVPKHTRCFMYVGPKC